MKSEKIPKGTFALGATAGVFLGIPATALALALLARVSEIGDPTASVATVLRYSAVFAGLPALVSGGGVARLIAHRLAERKEIPPSLWRTGVAGAVLMAVVGVGLVVLTAVPIGGLPEVPLSWTPLGAAGLIAGAPPGVLIGALVGVRQRRSERKQG